MYDIGLHTYHISYIHSYIFIYTHTYYGLILHIYIYMIYDISYICMHNIWYTYASCISLISYIFSYKIYVTYIGLYTCTYRWPSPTWCESGSRMDMTYISEHISYMGIYFSYTPYTIYIFTYISHSYFHVYAHIHIFIYTPYTAHIFLHIHTFATRPLRY